MTKILIRKIITLHTEGMHTLYHLMGSPPTKNVENARSYTHRYRWLDGRCDLEEGLEIDLESWNTMAYSEECALKELEQLKKHYEMIYQHKAEQLF